MKTIIHWFLGTPKDQPSQVVTVEKRKGFPAENIARTEQEMGMLEREPGAVEKNYEENVLYLTLIRAYLRTLMGNIRVASFLKTNHAETSAQFAEIAAAEVLLRRAQQGDGARASARFNVLIHEARKTRGWPGRFTLKRRERRAPFTPCRRHPDLRASI